MIPLGWRGASPNSLRAACAVADGMDSLGDRLEIPQGLLVRIWRSRSQSILRSIQIAPNGGRSKNGSLFGDGSSDRHLIPVPQLIESKDLEWRGRSFVRSDPAPYRQRHIEVRDVIHFWLSDSGEQMVKAGKSLRRSASASKWCCYARAV
jgi:hypothetical protein